MGLFKSSQIKIDQIDNHIANLKNHPLTLSYEEKWGEFVETNSYLWIKEKTELDMVFSINFDSISNSLSRMLSSRDIKNLDKKYKACNKNCVYYSCLIGIGFSVTNRKIVTSIDLLPQAIKNVYELTYLPSTKLFELIFLKHYKNNPHMSFQKDGHISDTKNGIIRRAQSTFMEGCRAAQKLNYAIF